MFTIWELKKCLSAKYLWVLLAVFIAFNAANILGDMYMSGMFKKTSDTAKELGIVIDDGFKTAFKEKYDREAIDEDSKEILGTIRNWAEISGEVYPSIDLAQYAQSLIGMYGLKGQTAEVVNAQFSGPLQQRVEQIIETGEGTKLAPIGKPLKPFEKLYGLLFLSVLFEAMFMAVLLTAGSVNHEFNEKTDQLIYSTKHGRKLIRNKLFASAAASGISFVAIALITAIVYFSAFDYSGVFNSPVSAAMSMEWPLPYITWQPMTIMQYALACFCFGLILTIVLCLIAFILAVFIKNNYIVFAVFAFIFGAFVILPSLLPLDSILLFIVPLNPFQMLLSSGNWFIGTDVFTCFENYQSATLLIWIVICAVMLFIGFGKFKRENI